MKNIKSLLSFMVISIIILTSSGVFADGDVKFKDIKTTDWYTTTVSKLVGLGGIEGYSDGTFKPNNEITRAEFIKILLGSIGYNEEPSKTGHWATNYFNKAVELGVITDVRVKGAGVIADIQTSELGIIADMDKKDLDKPIKRHEATRLIYMAMQLKKEKMEDDWHDYIYQIKDSYDIPVETQRIGITDSMGTVYHTIRSREKILQVYSKGIITGYPDGTFKPNKSLTRAEGSTVIMRLIDEVDRKLPSKPILEKDWIEPEFQLFYTTDYKDEYSHFEIGVVNRKEYEDKGQYENYKFTTILLSPNRIQNVLEHGIINQKWFEYDVMSPFKNLKIGGVAGSGFYYSNMIYKFDDIRRSKNIDTKEPLVIKEGEELKYKIIVSNGKKQKEYYVNAEFRNKKFRH